MIHYELRCDGAHEFDGWFKNSASFEQQAENGLLNCPTCGSAHVARALMAPAVAKRGRRVPQADRESQMPAVVAPAPAVAVEPKTIPDQVRAALQQMRAKIEKHCDYVGEQFADEARRIHRGETEARGIYGEATPEQAETLADEGIEIARIPWVPRADG